MTHKEVTSILELIKDSFNTKKFNSLNAVFYQVALDSAIELVNKQEPVAIIEETEWDQDGEGQEYSRTIYRCSSCNDYISRYNKYCCNCGVKLEESLK